MNGTLTTGKRGGKAEIKYPLVVNSEFNIPPLKSTVMNTLKKIDEAITVLIFEYLKELEGILGGRG